VKAAILGLGTIGSYIALYLSDLEILEELVLVDYDKIESKNLKNSAFLRRHVGMLKTEAIQEIIDESNDIIIHPIHAKFIEGETKLPISVDYIIDCRDITYNRKNIDVRLYFSGRSLIVDCRNESKYEVEKEGIYTSTLTRTDVINAANAATMLFKTKIINRFINERVVYRHELDTPKITACDFLDERKSNSSDYVYESCESESTLLNLHESVNTIIDMNQSRPTTLFVGPRDHSSFTKIIPKDTLVNITDVMECLTNSIDLPFRYPYYLVAPGKRGSEYFIELIPETGAA